MLDSFATHRAPRASGPSGLIVILAALVGLAGCTGNVAVDGNWAEGTARRGGFANLLVVGVSPDYNQRCAFEQSMAYSLRSSTVQVTTSCAVLGISEPLTRDAVVAAVKKIGSDAVLATTLVDLGGAAKEGGSADARGAVYYKATDIDRYFATTVATGRMVNAPSVFSIAGTARLSTDLFETKGATLVYSMDTRAKDLESRGSALADICPAIASRLRSDGLVR